MRLRQAVIVSVTVVMLASTSCSSDKTDTSPTVTNTVTESGSSREASSTQVSTTATQPSVPITVNGDYPSLQKWANDVSARDEDALVRKCWTYPASYIKERYLGTNPETLKTILSSHAEGAQAGYLWRADGGQVTLTDQEAKSDYACPFVAVSGQDMYTDDYVRYIVERYIRAAQGNPMNPVDGERDPKSQFECFFKPGEHLNVEKADPNSMSVTRTADVDQAPAWNVTAGDVEFKAQFYLAHACVQSSQ